MPLPFYESKAMKQYILPLIALAGIGLTSCDEDYTDWAKPQSYDQEASTAAKTLTAVTGSSSGTTYDATTTDTLHLLSISATGSYAIDSVFINDSYAVPFTLKGDSVLVTKTQLDSVVHQAYFSQASTQRTLSVKAKGAVIDASGQALLVTAPAQSFVYTTSSALPAAESAYFLVGSMNGWNLAGKGNPMTDNGDGTFSATFTTTGDCYYKIFGLAGVNASNWDAGMGALTGQDGTTPSFIHWTAQLGKQPEALYIKEAGTYTVTLDAVNWTYKYEKQ